MKSFFPKIVPWVKVHRKLSAVILVALVVGGYGTVKLFSSGALETRYVLAAVERGSILSTISGSGQVSASDQVTLSAKASGDLIWLNVKAGQEVKTGATIAQIDSGDAYYDLETAKLSYDKLVTTDPNDLRSAENDVTDAERDLEDSYTSARTSLSKAATDMSDVLHGLEDLYDCNTGYLSECKGYSDSDTKKEYRQKGASSWYDADKQLEDFIKKYQTISRVSTEKEIEAVVDEAYDTALAVSETAKYTQDTVIYYRDHSDNSYDKSSADTAYTTVTPLVSSANTAVSNVALARSSITSNKRILENARVALEELKDGPDALDLRSSELSLRQKQDALSDYYVIAPFAGVIASVTAKKGDSVNNGTAIATLITKKKIAEISLNEIDVVKIKIGQKATLTFDALEDLTITGEVAEVDSIGTVSQGVVSYKVKIAFDVDDDRVKSGMSVSASIITDMKQGVLVVPISAIKTQGGNSYVEIVDGEIPPAQSVQTAGVTLSTSPTQVPVVVGLSSDESIEIVSGLTEGQHYVVRTITATATTKSTTATAPSLLGGGAVRTGGGGGGNFPR